MQAKAPSGIIANYSWTCYGEQQLVHSLAFQLAIIGFQILQKSNFQSKELHCQAQLHVPDMTFS